MLCRISLRGEILPSLNKKLDIYVQRDDNPSPDIQNQSHRELHEIIQYCKR